MTTIAELSAGFSDKVLSAQSTFRSVMDAMARPGTIQTVDVATGMPSGMMRGTAAIALTLFDHDTPVWLDPGMAAASDVVKWLKFHTGAPVVEESSICSFALIGDVEEVRDLSHFSFGSSEYPDRSTTLIVQVESLTDGAAHELRGPGIDGAAVVRVSGECRRLLDQLAINQDLFPRGIDVVLVSGDALVAIPRSTRLVACQEGV